MGCFSSKPIDPPPPPPPARVLPPSAPPQPIVKEPSAPLTRQSSRRSSRHESMSQRERSSNDLASRKRVESAPEWAQLPKSSSPEDPRSRAHSTSVPRRAHRSDSRPPVPEVPKSARVPTMSYPGRRPLTSMLKQSLADHSKFRILVVGKKGSGKSSLINTIFKVDTSFAPQGSSGKRNINLEFHPEDNRYLIVHECSGFEPGDAEGLQSIRDFILYRTDPSRSGPERLHAVWICVPIPDAINGSIGDGIREILALRGLPVVVAFTKFDLVVSTEGYSESARASAYAQCEELSRSLFRKEPRDVPAEIVSVYPQYLDLIGNLVVTTDRLIMGSRVASTSPARRSNVQGAKPRIAPAPLVWSVALRASQDISIQASIEVGRSRYWRGLGSNLDFADQQLKNCVNIIHLDIVDIWNMHDKARYLTSNRFKEKISHVVKDLAESASAVPLGLESGDRYAEWVYDVYRGSQENVRCVMGYIVDLTVILDDIYRTATDSVSIANNAKSAVEKHITSGRRDWIHGDIRSFVTETSGIRFAVPQKDLVLERTIDLIRQYCVPPSGNS